MRQQILEPKVFSVNIQKPICKRQELGSQDLKFEKGTTGF